MKTIKQGLIATWLVVGIICLIPFIVYWAVSKFINIQLFKNMEEECNDTQN